MPDILEQCGVFLNLLQILNQIVGGEAIGRRWQFIGEAGYEKYSDDIADSPIALDDYEAEIGISALYIF